MNDYTRRCLEAGQRCRQWKVDYAALIPDGTIFKDKANQMKTAVDDMETIAGQMAAAGAEAGGATTEKSVGREDVIATLEPVRNAARAAEPDHPGIQTRYRFNRNLNNEDLLAVSRSFVEGAAQDLDLLKDYGAPDKWDEHITEAANAWEADMAAQDSAQGTSVAKHAELTAKRDEFMQLKRTISAMVPNYCASDIGALAAWHTAAHVELPPKKKTQTP